MLDVVTKSTFEGDRVRKLGGQCFGDGRRCRMPRPRDEVNGKNSASRKAFSHRGKRFAGVQMLGNGRSLKHIEDDNIKTTLRR